ncbi:MAG: DGQHR domain-containing protein [Paraburkholderia tropica]|uniref:DGQHR domain-containing protein n=1 Tax=Paraburkholderia tropica TaxID=92647 RepID=UPI0031018526
MATRVKPASIVDLRRHQEGVDEIPADGDEVRYAMSLVRQGEHRFYVLSIPSNVLAACSFATTKDEDPLVGFQRVLDKKRAQDIADYVDSGGSIPSSVVLSAQPDSNFRSVDRSKTAAFKFDPHAFLIIDGQHRVFGFAKAKTAIRVPVVIYDNLTKEQEARLFIDINTKQRPVPKELLLAIKSLARSETDIEALLGQVFDLFHEDGQSALLGWTSSSKKASSKLDRVTFNAGLRPHLSLFDGRDAPYMYGIWNAYFQAVMSGLNAKQVPGAVTKKTTFRAFCDIFPEVVQRVQDRYRSKYIADNFARVIEPVFTLASTNFSSPKTSILELATEMKKKLRAGLAL